MTLTVFFCSFAVASAQEELTVYEGTGTNSYVPVYGFYAEHYNKCEFIIPASVLSETMTGGEISKMSFYLSSPTPASDSWGSASFKVFLKEVSSTAISAFSGTDDATVVYEGALDGSGSTMDILFSNNYTYDGGNLLVGVYQTVIGSYKSASFYGQTVSNASISGYSSNSLDAINATQRNFIPKTTFTYIPRGDVYYFKPKDLTAGGISDVEATLSWNISSSASGVTGFSYQYKTAVAEWGTDETTLTGTSVTLSGLTPQTEYDFRIKANYDGSSSDWCALSFRTTVAGMSVGDSWNDDFEGSSCSWELVNGNLANKWFWGDAVSNDGEKSLYISNDGGTSHAYSNYKTMVYATKPLSFTEGKYEFSYDWKAYGESNFDFMRVALVPGSVELAADEAMPSGFSTTSLPAGWIALDGGSKLNQSTEWQHNTVAVNAAGIYYLAFAWRNDGSGGNNPPAAVDNVSVRHIVCSDEAVGFNITDITTNSATFAWQGSAGQWQVTYSTNGNFKDATSIIVDDLTYTITDLSPDTHYYVRVRACCDDNDYGTWSDVLQFYTDCVTITKFPWTENFDGYTIASSSSSRTLPNCWAAINTSTNSTYKIYPTIHKSSASTSNCLYFLSSYSPLFFDLDSRDQYVILPQMDNLDGKRITLNAKGDNTNSTFKIGMMTDPTDVSTFTEIATQDGLTVSYQAFEYQLEDKGQYVAIMIEAANSSNSQNGVFIDDITIDDFPVKPKDLTVNYTVGTTAEVSWTSTESAWDIDVNGSVTSNVTNPYTLTDLEYATKYTVKVRASRGEEISNWSDSVCFTTTISCPAPTDLAVTLTSGNGTVAALSWTENGTATAWEVAYKVEGAIEFTETDADSNPFTLTNLTPETTYTAKVRAVNSDGEKSEWSDCVSFTPTNAYFITLNDGTDTNASIPVYNFLCNMGNRSQFIIPSTSLADLQWASLNKLTFYSPEESFDYGTAEFDAFMQSDQAFTF